MRKRVFKRAASLLLALSLAGCTQGALESEANSNDTQSASASEIIESLNAKAESNEKKEKAAASREASKAKAKASSSDIEEISIGEFGYMLSNGYVHYALRLDNPNENFAARFASIVITGKAEDGSIAFTDEWTVTGVPAKSQTYWASQAGSGNVDESVSITVKVKVSEDDWLASEPVDQMYSIENISTKTGTFDDLMVTGEITLLNEDEVVGHDPFSPMLVAVLRDEDGEMLGGFSTFIFSDLTLDDPTAFEIDLRANDLDFADVEVYANPWM